MLEKSGTALLEPVMTLEVVTDERCLPTVMSDLSRRRSQIKQIRIRGNNKVARLQ